MPKDKKQIKLISWNVNGLRAVLKKDFFAAVETMDPDILMLQETKLQEDQRTHEMIFIPPFESFWNYSTVKKGYSGVAAYSKLVPAKVITNFETQNILTQLPRGSAGSGHRLPVCLRLPSAWLF